MPGIQVRIRFIMFFKKHEKNEQCTKGINIKIDKDVLIHIIFAVVLRRRERPDLPPTISSVIPLVLR